MLTPLHPNLRAALINVFLNPSLKAQAHAGSQHVDCLVRPYLVFPCGTVRSIPARTFNLRNYPLYLDRFEHLGLDPRPVATSMARTLAVLHWSARCDAGDVEFVFGDPAPEEHFALTVEEIAALPPRTDTTGMTEGFRRRTTQLWLLDFNRVRDMAFPPEGVAQAVEEFVKNDKYFPRPNANLELWLVFKDAYLYTSSEVLHAAGAIHLDPDPTVLRGMVTLGNQLRYWSYSSSAADQYKSSKRRLRHGQRGSNNINDRVGGVVRSNLKDYIAHERHELDREKQQRKKESERFRARGT